MNEQELKELKDFMATEVMGWKLSHTGAHGTYWKDDGHHHILNLTGDDWLTTDSYTPTTDMNQAMECVEKADLKGFSLTRGGDLYHCQINGASVYDKSAPLAICKALKKAMEAQ